MKEKERALVVGAGLSGLVAAKELLDVGIENITIVEKDEELGGVWRKYCWNSATLTSSKWMTEFGSYPMPEEYPDFMKPEQMMAYLHSFAKHFGLIERMSFGVEVKAIARNAEGKYDVTTNQGSYNGYDFVVVSTGLHGRPSLKAVPGLEKFGGTVMHSHGYKQPSEFRDQRVLCMGLGESGLGISSEISNVAAKTIVSSSSFTPAPRVFPYSNMPFDQMQFWPIGRFIKDYQEMLTLQQSWITKLPEPLRSVYIRNHPWLRYFPKEWIPKAFIPNNWVVKYWPKPNCNFGDVSGNLTRPEVPTDDILYLLYTGKIVPKGPVASFEAKSVEFADGSREEIDAVVANTGFKPGACSLQFPNNWQYRYQDLYKGCLHPDMPNLAFVGNVRPTVGSIPAMAEMQARLVAQVFSGQFKLPEPKQLQELVKKESSLHARKWAAMHLRWPHVYFFDRWMEEMADLIGSQPKIWQHLGSWKQLQAYLFGAPMPLRFRQYGPGAIADARDRYAERVNKIYGKPPVLYAQLFIISSLLYPHVLTLLIGAVCFWAIDLSAPVSMGLAATFWTLYMTIDVLRFALSLPIMLILKQWMEHSWPWSQRELESMTFFLSVGEKVDYANPKVFERDMAANTERVKAEIS